ncbi:MAG: aldo/keto reductase [Terrimesophilobacter sp.]
MTAIPTYPMNDGRTIPAIGFGTYNLHGEDGIAAVVSALQAGYRLLDTALNYGNEVEVGEAIRRSGISREEIMVTTKLPGRHHGFDETLASFEESRGNLGLEYVDLYLIHWPIPRVDKYVDTWRAMIQLREQGLVRSIGVSNFTQQYLERLIDETDVAPAVNQIELHPRFPQTTMRQANLSHGIVTESWSPLARQHPVDRERAIVEIAARHGVTPAQVVVRWHIQLGAVPVPKSASPRRQAENLDVFGFTLTEDEVSSISALESGRLWGGDPETHEEF